MNPPLVFNSSDTCYIFPRLPNYPNGTYLNFNTCPENYDSTTRKLIRLCCFEIMGNYLKNTIYGKIVHWLTYYSSTFLIFPALFFNLLSFIILTKLSKLSSNGVTSTNFYMKCVCILDTLTVLIKFLHEIIVVRNGIRDASSQIVFDSIFCKISNFSESLFAISAIYLLIAMSFDKLVCIVMPLKASSLLTPKKARIICAIIILIAASYSSYHLIIQEMYILNAVRTATSSDKSSDDNSTAKNVKIKKQYICKENSNLFSTSISFMDNIIRVFVPILLLFISNMICVIALSREKKKVKTMLALEYSNSNIISSSKKTYKSSSKGAKDVFKKQKEEKTNEIELQRELNSNNGSLSQSIDQHNFKQHENCSIKSKKNLKKEFSELEMRAHTNQIRRLTSHYDRVKRNSFYITMMSFAICFGFILFNLPFVIKTIIDHQLQEQNGVMKVLYSDANKFTIKITKSDFINTNKYDFFVCLTHFLVDLNYIANFFFYFLSGSRFRSQLYDLFDIFKQC